MRFFSFMLAVVLASSPCFAQTSSKKSLSKPCEMPLVIFYNGVIYTGEGLTEDRPQTVSAMAVCNDKIAAIGTNDEIIRLAAQNSPIVNLSEKNAIIFPGINDAHVHLGEAGRMWQNLDLTGVPSLNQMLAKVQAFTEKLPDGKWITGGNWDHTLWNDKVLPTRQQLDAVTGDHPTFLIRIDGHIAVANSAALAAAHITEKTTPPQGAAIDLDTNGKLTGILRENAQQIIEKVIPEQTHEERYQADLHAINDALEHGITSVQDNSDWRDFLIYEEMETHGDLHLHITEWLPFSAPLSELQKMRAHHDAKDPMLHTGQLKGFMDGSLGSRTAAMKAPYADDPKNSGLPQYTQDQLNSMVLERARAGFQFGFHAIGDKASEMALNAFAQQGVSKTARNRIEHAQVVDPADISRFAKLGVIASMQPNHLLTDMNWAEDRLGHKRAEYSYAWKDFLNAGVHLSFGTDYPVEPITPFRGLYAAVTRTNENGDKVYFQQNKLTRGQALYAYTQGSAYAEFAEKRKGRLLPGYDADFIFVDRDIYKTDVQNLLHTVVLETWVAGKQAYKRINIAHENEPPQ